MERITKNVAIALKIKPCHKCGKYPEMGGFKEFVQFFCCFPPNEINTLPIQGAIKAWNQQVEGT